MSNLDSIGSVSASSGTRYTLIPEETRVKLVIDSIVNIGDCTYTQPDQTTKVTYKIGICFTSNVPKQTEDGAADGFHSFMQEYAFKFHPKSSLSGSGILEAVGYDTKRQTLKDFLVGTIGKQVSALVEHRQYTTRSGGDGVAMELVKFKAVTSEDDFTEALQNWKPNYRAVRNHPDKLVVTVENVKNPKVAIKKVIDY